MAYTTTATGSESFSFDTREQAVVKAVELVQGGAKGVTVKDEDSGEETSGEDLLDAVDDLADGEEPA